MKNLLLACAVSLTCVSANASAPKKLEVNCDNVDLDIGGRTGDEFHALVKWEYPAVFPNLPKKIIFGDTSEHRQEGFEFDCPQLYVRYDGNKLTVKADTVEAALNALTSDPDKSFDLYSYVWYMYPSIREGYNVIKYSINLNDYSLKSGYMKVGEGKKVESSLFSTGINDNVVIGYKIDGGKLEPLLYNSKVDWYANNMLKANIIDIYHKNEDRQFRAVEKIKRIHIDKSKGLVEIYKKYPFPSS